MVVPKYPQPIVGGLEQQAHELSKALVARGHSVSALSYAHHPSNERLEVRDGVTIHRIGSPATTPVTAIAAAASLTKAIYGLRRTTDVVHIHVPSWFGAFALKFARTLRKPCLFKLSNVAELGIPGLRKSMEGRIRLSILSRSDGIVAMTSESLRELESIRYPAEKTLFRPNGISITSPSERDLRKKADRTVRVVFLGRLSWEKRLPDLLAAWSLIGSLSCPAVLQIVGDGPDRSQLESLSRELGLQGSVQFLGHVPNVEDVLGKSDIFVLPSHIEGNSNAVLEAMRSSLPIVASRISGTCLQVGAEGAQLLFDVGDVVRLSELLRVLIGDPALRAEAGVAMRRRVERKFSMTHVAADYERAYLALMARSSETLGAIGSTEEEQFDTTALKREHRH